MIYCNRGFEKLDSDLFTLRFKPGHPFRSKVCHQSHHKPIHIYDYSSSQKTATTPIPQQPKNKQLKTLKHETDILNLFAFGGIKCCIANTGWLLYKT